MVCRGSSSAIWLSRLGIVHEFFVDVFMKGPAAKGASPGAFVQRAILVALDQHISATLGIMALVLLWPVLRRSGAARHEREPDTWLTIIKPGLLCAACITAGAIASYRGLTPQLSFTTPASYFLLAATLALMLHYAWIWLRGPISAREAQLALLATVSFVMAFMVSLSWPIFEAMLLPGIGFLTVACLDGLNGWRRNALYGFCAALLVTHTCLKLNMPFCFSGFGEPPVSAAVATSTIPELRGLRLPPDIVEFIDGTARIVQGHSTAGDTIFTYPEMGIFYTITHRRFPTVSGSHNIDVVNDAFAHDEAQRLLTSPPRF